MTPSTRFLAPATLAMLMALSASPVFAQSTHSEHGHAGHGAAAPATGNAEQLADGEIRRIDTRTARLTLRHGEIKSLDMPPMTMVFHLADPGMLEGLKVGDRIRFAVEQRTGRMVITRIVATP